MSEGRCKYRSLAPREEPSGVSAGVHGPTARTLSGAGPFERELDLEDLGVRAPLRALADGGGQVVHPHPAINGEFRDRAQCVGEG